MNALLGISLLTPLVGAVAVVVAGHRVPWIVRAAAGTATAGFAIVAAAGSPPSLGRIEVDPVLAAAAAGLAAVIGLTFPASQAPAADVADGRAVPGVLPASMALCAVTLFAATAGIGAERAPDRPLAVGVLFTVAVAAVSAHAVGAGRLALTGVVVGGAASAAGLVLDDADRGAALVLGGAAVLLATLCRRGAPGAVLLAPVLLVADRVVGFALQSPAGMAAGGRWVAVAASAVVAVGALWAVHRSVAAPTHVRLAAIAAAGSVLTLTIDVPDARSAGLLLGAGAVLTLVAAHPLGALAALPGLVATIEALGPAGGSRSAAAGGALVVLLLVAAVGIDHPRLRAPWRVLPAVAFALLPASGWAGASLPDLGRSVAVGSALALAAAVAVVAGSQRKALAAAGAPAVLTTVREGVAGRIGRRRSGGDTLDGSIQEDVAHEDAEGIDDAVEGPPAS